MMRPLRRLGPALLLATLVGLAAPGPTPLRAAEAAAFAKPVFEVETRRDLTYRELRDGEDAKKDKNKLDLYLPKGAKNFPVLFFVHGGAWRHFDKESLGVNRTLGKFFASRGIAMVATNYRLTPAVQHPEHVKDVAEAFAWTHKNVTKYGGSTDNLFVCGHSAGGHLVALLTTDESYLKAQGLTGKAIRGAVPISGVYDVTAGLPLFQNTFGKDEKVRQEASPVNRVTGHEPPFLIIYADKDFVTCDLMSENFCKALKARQRPAETLKVNDRNHISVLTETPKDGDPVGKAILEFIAKHFVGKVTAAKEPQP